MPNIDQIDIQILTLLQENGRVSQHELARAVGLSPPALADRLRKLEERGVIRHYAAVLDPKKLELDIGAFIFVGTHGSKFYPDFRSRASARAEVQECHSVTGQGSHLLKVRVRDTDALEKLLADVQAWPGVQWTTTSVVLSTVKEGSRLSLTELDEEATEEEDDDRGRPDLLLVPFRHHT